MKQRIEFGGKQGWLASLLLIPILIAAAVVGFFVFLAILGLVLFVAVVLMLRLWWLRRKLRRSGPAQVIEGDFVVVRETLQRNEQSHR
jgi:hypothetical protein